MICERCFLSTRVLETRATENGAVTRRMHRCPNGHKTTTYEITQAMYNAAKFDIAKAVKGQAYNKDLEQRRAVAAAMRAERLAGVPCPTLADKYKMSLHMVRYYTRLPRSKLYPAAKNGGHPSVQTA